jgi:hypothetical protein
MPAVITAPARGLSINISAAAVARAAFLNIVTVLITFSKAMINAAILFIAKAAIINAPKALIKTILSDGSSYEIDNNLIFKVTR